MGEYRKYQEEDDGHRHRPDHPLAPELISGAEGADRLAAGENQRQAAEDRHAAKRDDKGRNLQAADSQPLQCARHQTDGDGCSDRCEQTITVRFARARAEQAATALLYGGGDQSCQGQHRAYREINPAGEDDEGHTDRQHAVDGDLPDNIENVARAEERRLQDGKDDT